ncbi:hypothetical protein M513_14038 [Trichuris suis]|uniref:Uncharacterized protein n=1 Tax=Trichuris suis TaxID=68888 RepID=A0A085LJE3_9BILA|nr:hypothetical protein M513_14038 [Trichuris suis]
MKQHRFEELRRLNNNDKKRLAEVVLDDHPAKGHNVPLTDCLEFYRSIFASPLPPDDANVLPKTNAAGSSPVDVLLSLITEEEITTALKKIASRFSPGPDRISLDMVKSVDQSGPSFIQFMAVLPRRSESF